MTAVKFKLTIEDCVMLHLMHNLTASDDFEVPVECTQPGIADTVGIRRSHASYVLKILKQKGFVTERLAHVKNIARKRKSYFLTDDGKRYALKLRDNLSRKSVIYRDKNGKQRTIKLSEIKKELPVKIPLVRLINSITPEGELDYNDLISESEVARSVCTKDSENKFVNHISSMLLPTHFVGRTNEIKTIKGLIKKELPKCLVIKGIAGIGKTTLTAKIIDEYSKARNRNLFWYKAHEWDTKQSILVEIAEFLIKLNRKKLKFYLDNQQTIDLPEISKVLEEDLQDLELLSVFDDFQKLNENVKQLFSLLIELLESKRLTNFNLLILTRDSAKFYDRRNVAIKKLIAELELSGLDFNASKKLLNIKNINEKQFNKIFKITEGHPLTLELIGIQISSRNDEGKIPLEFNFNELFKEQHDITKYIREEIFSKLKPPEKKLLDIASVFRYPVPADAVLVEKNLDYECIDSLLEKSLLHETTAGLELHELIKEFIYRRLSPKQQIKYHKQAAKFYTQELKGMQKVEDGVKVAQKIAIEAMFHNMCARNFPAAGKLSIEHGDGIINKGFTEEYIALLNELDSKKVPSETWGELLIQKGFILTIKGDWDSALKLYQESLSWSKQHDDRIGLARANNAIGIIHYRKGDLKKAMNFFKRGLSFANANDDKKNSSKLYSNIALVHWGNGKLDLAIELNKKSLQISKKLGDKHGIARAHNNLGIIFWEQQKLNDAIKEYNKSLKLSEELGDIRTIAILYDNLGEAYRLKGNDNEAGEFYKKSLQLSKELGFKWQIAEVNCNLGILFKKSDAKKSKYYLNSALEMYKILGASREVEKVKKIIAKK